MPKSYAKIEKELDTRTKKMGLKGERKNAYKYGTIAKIKEARSKKYGK